MSALTRYGLIALAALVAFAIIVGAVAHREHELIDQGRQETKAAVESVQAKLQADQRVQAQKTADQQAENRREGNRMHEQEVADGRDGDAALKRLQDTADRNRRTAAEAASAAAAGTSGGLPTAYVVPRELYDGCVNRVVRLGGMALELAKSLTCSRNAGRECTQDYDALMP